MYSDVMFDAADPNEIPQLDNNAAVIAGYLNPGDPLRPWKAKDWAKFPKHRKLPILVRSDPTGKSEAEDDAFAGMQNLYDLGALECLVALDIETALDPAYVTRFGTILNTYGYRVLPYGSRDNLLSLPKLDGRWLAAPGMSFGDFPRADDIRAIQNVYETGYDKSDLRPFLSMHGAWWI
jgi:hypothetical protein